MRRRQSHRPMIISFSLTILVLTGIALGLTLMRPTVQVLHLPSQLPSYSALWSRYVPVDAVLFGFENYTLIRQYNASYPLYSDLLLLPDLKLRLPASSINYILTVVLSTPNETVDIAFVNQQAFSNFSAVLEQYSYAAVSEGSNKMYYVRDITAGSAKYGWLAVIPSDGAVAFAIGADEAKQAVQEVLFVQQGAITSIIERSDVRSMLYIANGTGGHLAIGLQDFPGVVRSGKATLTVVNSIHGQVEVSRIVEFNSTSFAVAQWTAVRSAYLSATKIVVYDSFVQATETHPLTNMVEYVRLVE